MVRLLGAFVLYGRTYESSFTWPFSRAGKAHENDVGGIIALYDNY